MTDEYFYHEDLVLQINHELGVIFSGHVEGGALSEMNDILDSGSNISISDNESTTNIHEANIQIPSITNQDTEHGGIGGMTIEHNQKDVSPKQFGDKSSEHDDTIDSIFIDLDNQFDNGFFEGPFKGHIYVRWNAAYYQEIPDLSNAMQMMDSIPGNSLIKLDRYHQLSDIVKHRISGDIGVVTRLRKNAIGEIVSANKLLVDIDCTRLRNIEKFFSGTTEQIVVYNSWLGKVTSISRHVVVKFPDGAKLRISEEALENFQPIFNVDIPELIFHGACLKGDPRYFKTAKSIKFIKETKLFNSTWLSELQPPSQNNYYTVQIIIIKVILTAAKVEWFMYKPKEHTDKPNPTPPPKVFKGPHIQNLKSVNSRPYIYSYTGDVWYYQLREDDKIYSMSDEYTISKLLYKLYQKEHLDHLKISTKHQKAENKKAEFKSPGKKENKFKHKKSIPKVPSKSSSKSSSKSKNKEKIPPNQMTKLSNKSNANVNKFQLPINKNFCSDIRRFQGVSRHEKRPIHNQLAKMTFFKRQERRKFQNWSNRESFNHRHKTKKLTKSYDKNHYQILIQNNENNHDKQSEIFDESSSTINYSKNHIDKHLPYSIYDDIQYYTLHRKDKNTISPSLSITHGGGNTSNTKETMGTSSNIKTKPILKKQSLSNTLPMKNQEANLKPTDGSSSGQSTSGTILKQHTTVTSTSPGPKKDKKLPKKSNKNSKDINNIKEQIKNQKLNREIVIDTYDKLQIGTWVPVQLVLIETLADVLWQNGELSTKVPSIDLLPELFDLDEYDFFPGSFVSSKKSVINEAKNKEIEDFGCIINASNTERMVTIQWFQNNKQKGDCSKVGSPETCGSYDIRHHGDFHYHIGDIVMIQPNCKKTLNPAGYICSINPINGTLKVRWPDMKHSYLYPTEFSGVLWDLLSDDFLSSDESTDISTLNGISDHTEAVRIFRSILNSHEANTTQESSYVLKVIKCVNNLFEIEETGENETLDKLQKQTEVFVNLKENLNKLNELTSSESLKLIYESFYPLIFPNGHINPLITNNELTISSQDIENGQYFNIETISNQLNPVSTPANFAQIIASGVPSLNQIRPRLLDLKACLYYWIRINEIEKPKYIDLSPTGNSEFLANLIGSRTNPSNDLFNFTNFREILPLTHSPEEVVHHINPSQLETLSISVYNNRPNRSLPEVSSTAPTPTLNREINEPTTSHRYEEADAHHHNQQFVPLPNDQRGSFDLLSEGEKNNYFYGLTFNKSKNSLFVKAWSREYNLLITSLPKGIWVKNFEARLDLFSVMIEGPEDTPYQNGLFFFDLHLPQEYPNQPPMVNFVSQPHIKDEDELEATAISKPIISADRLNPNLYPDGRVCLSLLGTWIGHGSENWNPSISTLLQVLVSLQGLILVSEPYFNEAGYETRRNTKEGIVNSRRFNESVITGLAIATLKLLDHPFKLFKNEIFDYYKINSKRYINTLKFWCSLTEERFEILQKMNKKLLTQDSVTDKDDEIGKVENVESIRTPLIEEPLTPATLLTTPVITSSDIMNNTKAPKSILESTSNFEQQQNTTFAYTNIKDDDDGIKIKNHIKLPQFTLAPVSKGFYLTLTKYIGLLEKSFQSYF